jgi:hypothetical protein
VEVVDRGGGSDMLKSRRGAKSDEVTCGEGPDMSKSSVADRWSKSLVAESWGSSS